MNKKKFTRPMANVYRLTQEAILTTSGKSIEVDDGTGGNVKTNEQNAKGITSFVTLPMSDHNYTI